MLDSTTDTGDRCQRTPDRVFSAPALELPLTTVLLLAACLTPPKLDTGGDDTGADTTDGESDQLSIPAGALVMGCEAAGCDADEAPVHTVTLSAYTIGRYEVTVEAYLGCVEAGACERVDDIGTSGAMPMTLVTWAQADSYCDWRGMRLPTEAEWERAARGEDGRRYPWGDEPPDCDRVATRACDGGLGPVGEHPTGAAPAGVEDLAGNAWEWVSDYYAADYYADSPEADPTGPSTFGLRSVRGIDLYSNVDALRASNRTFAIPDGRSSMVGFRCVGAPA